MQNNYFLDLGNFFDKGAELNFPLKILFQFQAIQQNSGGKPRMINKVPITEQDQECKVSFL